VNKILALALLTAPIAARADIGLRLGADADLAYNHNDGSGTHAITSNWPVGGDVMLSWWLPTNLIALDVEVSEQFLLSPPANTSGRTGTVLRPGVRLSPPILPFYVRGAIPINVETNGGSRETFDLRLGAGITIPLVLFKVYVEADADFPLGGGTNAPSAFSSWDLRLNGGLDFRF
jgi:hypothetical protein